MDWLGSKEDPLSQSVDHIDLHDSLGNQYACQAFRLLEVYMILSCQRVWESTHHIPLLIIADLRLLAEMTSLTLTGLLFAALVPFSRAQNFTNPIIWQDLADVDLLRVGDAYYYSSSNMHMSPSAPILRSYDLVNWEYLSHSIPTLVPEDPSFSLEGGNRYNAGVYASSLKYHEERGLFYWIGCLQGTGSTYIYTATDIEGPWEQTSVLEGKCYYDNGILIDDDGTIYIAYGSGVQDGTDAQVLVARLDDELQEAEVQVAFQTNEEIGYLEGARFYKINGSYFLWMTWHNGGMGNLVFKSQDGPYGPYTSEDSRPVIFNSGNPVPGLGVPYQAALVETPEADLYAIAFVNNWPTGRIPVLAPAYIDADGYPQIDFVSENTWGSTYPLPLPTREVKPIAGSDGFGSDVLGPQYEWNHNPDNSKWSVGSGLTLQTATVTDDFFMARNTLSHRILGPKSTATVHLDYSGMANGDQAGLAIFRYRASWLAISKSDSTTTLQRVEDALMDSSGGWHTVQKGNVTDSVEVSGGEIWLRVDADVTTSDASAVFSYSTDGSSFKPLGETYNIIDDAIFFVGDRYGIFNFAEEALGGQVVVQNFTLSQ